MKLTKSKLKQVIMEGLFDAGDDKMTNALEKLLTGINSLDTSVDYLSSIMSGESPLSMQYGQAALGRWKSPVRGAKPAVSAAPVRGAQAPASAALKEDAVEPNLGKHLEEAIASLYGAGYKAEEIREMVDGAFNTELKEVFSEKQRKWACAQMGDDFKGERKLTKKQAKEMCKSKVEK